MKTLRDDAARRSPWLTPRVVAGSLFALGIVLISAVAAWPIYRSTQFVLLVAVAVATATLLAAVSWRRQWRGWVVAAVLVAALLVLGVTLAVPAQFGALAGWGESLRQVVAGFFLAWKDLVTVELPVGSYRNLLVPPLVLFLAGTCVLLRLSWRPDRLAYLAVPLAIAMASFGLFFGRTSVSAPLDLPPMVLYAPVETTIGVGILVVCLAWLAWRTGNERVRALQRAADSSGIRAPHRFSQADRRRASLGAGMVAVAVLIGVVVVPLSTQDADREVLRSSVGPDIDLAQAASPLSQYRALFADERASDVIFTVTSDGALPSSVRIATLDAYDGEVYRSGGAQQLAEAAQFVRVPSTLDAGDGVPIEAEITIGALGGIWMPTLSGLEAVDFAGARSADLEDGFYYSVDAAAGVQTAGGGLSPGDSYALRAIEQPMPALAEIEASGAVNDGVAVPENLTRWVQEHAQGTDGAALESLVGLLRERGYLSHGLLLADQEQPAWASALVDYTVQPSASGHSLARIDTLFARLLERESDPRAQQADNYVAAIGDDEQFAVAAALIARELGFSSRVVMGVRIGDAPAGAAACDNGICEAQDVSVWTEVASADGEWVAIDVTPQYANTPSLDVTELRDPENVTEVRPDAAEPVLPPDPVQQDAALPDDDNDSSGIDLAWLWSALRITAIVLLVLLIAFGPFLMVVTAKAVRRRSRQRATAPAERIAGAWDEYVDTAIDVGFDAPVRLTRRELAATFHTPAAVSIADAADRAVFSGTAVTDSDVDVVWTRVARQSAALRAELPALRRLLASVSLRSFIHRLEPTRGARSPIVQKGRRATPARPTL
ncbi:transglutaminase-like domain-containing protein [Microbacterium sp. NPDC076911]|uniref:transglutaminase-like domain-containing protein n=1 Tax=Microbacterium sp. NPDC076911 TaxID=3154958 RepID=UPI003432792A